MTDLTLTEVDPSDVRLAACPLPGCHRGFITAPGQAEQPGALADVFGAGVFAAYARHQRLSEHEKEIRDHLTTHSAEAWAIALAGANSRIRELEAVAAPITERQHRNDHHHD